MLPLLDLLLLLDLGEGAAEMLALWGCVELLEWWFEWVFEWLLRLLGDWWVLCCGSERVRDRDSALPME